MRSVRTDSTSPDDGTRAIKRSARIQRTMVKTVLGTQLEEAEYIVKSARESAQRKPLMKKIATASQSRDGSVESSNLRASSRES